MSSADLYTDGAARGNPGPASSAWALKSDERIIILDGVFLGKATNNVAEYTALIHGLEAAIERDINEIVVHSDSELMVRQLNGEYQVKSERLRPLYQKVKELLSRFEKTWITHHRREDPGIGQVDALCNSILDQNRI